MDTLEFDWDEKKARRNTAVHGVTFEFACGIFGDPFAAELLDDREAYGEARSIILGMCAGVFLVVTYMERAARFG